MWPPASRQSARPLPDAADQAPVVAISCGHSRLAGSESGSAAQICALGAMLFVSSMVLATYERAIRIFLVGLALVAVGVAIALLGEITGFAQNILGG